MPNLTTKHSWKIYLKLEISFYTDFDFSANILINGSSS